jgi:hypothetical protein
MQALAHGERLQTMHAERDYATPLRLFLLLLLCALAIITALTASATKEEPLQCFRVPRQAEIIGGRALAASIVECRRY